jgi:hypothetical protein
MTRPRHIPPLSVYPILLLALLLLFISSVSCAKNKRNDSLRQAVIAVNAARDGFTQWDLEYRKGIIDKATSRAEAEGALAKYDERKKPVVNGIEFAYRALAVAATQTDEPSLQDALTAASELVDSFKKLMGDP